MTEPLRGGGYRMTGTLSVATIQERFPHLVGVLVDSFVINPDRCGNRARVVQILQKKESLDPEFVKPVLPEEAGQELVRAAQELDGNAMMVYRAARVIAENRTRGKAVPAKTIR